jgi:hypothetical protein
MEKANAVLQKCKRAGHFGQVEISFFVDEKSVIYLSKVQFYLTSIGSSLYYFKFLADG